MTNRSAHATIKGYFYQFDHTIMRLLEAPTLESSVVVEGIEDIDLNDGDESAFVQCKYYEGSEYNHSIIKDAVVHMLKHFHSVGCPADKKFRYQIYGHYKEGQGKLPETFNLTFLKKNFLTFKRENNTHEVHKELGINDTDLSNFNTILDIDLNAPSYDDQQDQIIKLLVSHIPECNIDDARVFYYPNAINVIQTLAIQADANNRIITKAAFVSRVNRKEIVFSLWLRKKFGDNYYIELIKRKFFRFSSSTKIPKASRIFVLDMANEFDLTRAVSLLAKIGTTLSHKEHKRTPQQDRFCPYILLRGLSQEDLISIKTLLLKQGIKFIDGYPFHGSAFHPELLAADPTKENLICLKFIPMEEQIKPVISSLTGSVVEIFDFFKGTPLNSWHVPVDASHHPIKLESMYFLNEVLTV